MGYRELSLELEHHVGGVPGADRADAYQRGGMRLGFRGEATSLFGRGKDAIGREGHGGERQSRGVRVVFPELAPQLGHEVTRARERRRDLPDGDHRITDTSPSRSPGVGPEEIPTDANHASNSGAGALPTSERTLAMSW